MGFFSKLTADTQESVPSVYSGMPQRPVYLLQPNGLPPIREDSYEGYGVIGGVDWFVWLGVINAEHMGIDKSEFTEEELRSVGISLDCGYVFLDVETDQYWSIFHDHRAALNHLDVRFFKGRFSDVIPELGDYANALLDAGRLVRVPVRELSRAPHTIKLSFNENANYDSLPCSQDCPWQGYFYPDPSEENVQ